MEEISVDLKSLFLHHLGIIDFYLMVVDCNILVWLGVKPYINAWLREKLQLMKKHQALQSNKDGNKIKDKNWTGLYKCQKAHGAIFSDNYLFVLFPDIGIDLSYCEYAIFLLRVLSF